MKRQIAVFILGMISVCFSQEPNEVAGVIFGVKERADLSKLDLPIPSGIKEKKYIVFASEDKAISANQQPGSRSMSIYYAGDCFVDILDEYRIANIGSAKKHGFDLRFCSILAILVNPDAFLEKLSKSNKQNSLKLEVSPALVRYADGEHSYVIFRDAAKITSLEIHNKARNYFFAKIALDYGDSLLFPSLINIECFSNGKSILTKLYEVSLLKENAKAPLRFFEGQNMGPHRFVDNRFSPAQIYVHDNGVLSYGDAKVFAEAMSPKDKKQEAEKAWDEYDKTSPSQYVQDVGNFFKEMTN